VRHLLHFDRKLRRCWLLGRRYHHGKLGAQLVVVGVVLCAHDWHDRREWFRQARWT
jgi:hypothetical protein